MSDKNKKITSAQYIDNRSYGRFIDKLNQLVEDEKKYKKKRHKEKQDVLENRKRRALKENYKALIKEAKEGRGLWGINTGNVVRTGRKVSEIAEDKRKSREKFDKIMKILNYGKETKKDKE